jgi:methyl-accepting chemotaxis protein
MTDDELRTLVASNAEATRELRATVERQSQQIESQERIITEGLASLRSACESQLTAIENQRENIGHNAQMMADAMEMAAISQQMAATAQQMAAKSQEVASQSQETAAIALRVSAETTRNIARSEQILGIVIRDAQADRVRFGKLEGQN